MKELKILLIILIVTCITSIAKIYAYKVYTYTNLSIPGFNGSYYTGYTYIDTADMGQHHKVRDIVIPRDLDIRVQKYNPYESDNNTSGSWRLLQNGSSTNLTDSLSSVNLYMQGGDFRLHIDSRIYYLTSTQISNLLWYLEV